MIRSFRILIPLVVFASCSAPKMLGKQQTAALVSSPALLNAHVGIALLDNTSGRWFAGYQSDKYFVPASNTKIATCYAAMKYLGDSLPALIYKLTGDNSIEISGTGDPSFLLAEYRDQPALSFLKKYKSILFRSPIFEGSLGNGWSWNDYQEPYMAPRSPLPLFGNLVEFRLNTEGLLQAAPTFFAQQVRTTGESLLHGFTISRNWDNNEFTGMKGKSSFAMIPFNANPGTIRELLSDTLKADVELDPFGEVTGGTVLYSRPVDSLLKPLMHRSDNFFAEQALMMLTHRLNGTFDIDKVMDSLLNTEFSSLPQRPRWADGSGLSRYNLFTPMDLVSILRMMTQLPDGLNRMKTILATGGEGTLANYYVKEKDFIYAKTGTLSGVVAISGLLYTKKGRELIFSVLVNNHRSSATDVRRAVEKYLEEIREKY